MCVENLFAINWSAPAKLGPNWGNVDQTLINIGRLESTFAKRCCVSPNTGRILAQLGH